ncbi:MAG TPA: cytochrome c oxidase subunit 3, partial [Xanthobacteraceae bacterium]|nr:cytochrome c oxidase subunit 3 [Xanthobacteraceae bacterium]
HAKHHDYHLVDPSPWPIIGAISALAITMGGVYWIRGGTSLISIAGILGIVYVMIAWWRDVINEGEHKGDHTSVVQLSLRYGMILFIASEVMFFVAWFWAYFDAALFPAEPKEFMRTELLGGHWPPVPTADDRFKSTFDPWHLPLLNTLILLTSGTTVTWAHHALLENDRKGLIQGLWLTIILGATFTCVQAFEYSHAAFTYAGHIYGSTFFMATGFHGAHVIISTIFLSVCLLRAYLGHFKPDHHFGFEAAAWYWHFVDVVWLFLFTFIYVWGAGTPMEHGG